VTGAVCSKPVQLTNSRDEYLITALKHKKAFNIAGLSPFFWLVTFYFIYFLFYELKKEHV